MRPKTILRMTWGGDDLALEDDGNASPADPRWDALKGLLENDNN